MRGWGLWAVEVVADRLLGAPFVGFVGLERPRLRDGVHAVRRDRLASREGTLGPGLRE